MEKDYWNGIEQISFENFEQIVNDVNEIDLDGIKAHASQRINQAITIGGYKKVRLYEYNSYFQRTLAKQMGKNGWGLSPSSIKNYVSGRFGKDRQQFIDFMYGVRDFFNLPHVRDIFEANDITFEVKICRGLNLTRKINVDATQKAEPAKASEAKAETSDDSPQETITPIQFSHVTALKDILPHIVSCKPFRAGALITFSVCFAGNIIGCYFAGTLIGDNPERIYFLRDASSLINYIFICPVYVGLNCVLIDIYLKLKKTMPIDVQNEAPDWFKKIPKTVWVCVFIGLFLILAIRQEFEMLNPAIYPRLYWYIGNVTASGERVFGFIGIYYSFYNSVLLFFLLFPFVLFVKLLLISKAVIEHLNQTPVTAKAKETLKKQCGYIVLKLIVVVYIGNACTWKMANPEQSFNYLFMATALTVVGLGIVPFFRYHIKTSLHRLEKSGWLNDDIRPSYTTELVYFLNVLIVLSFVYVCWF